jgi:N-acetyl-D-muramate 6-phosphate phosphatase
VRARAFGVRGDPDTWGADAVVDHPDDLAALLGVGEVPA